MILLLGGTTEGRLLSQRLDAAGIGYLYSTKTPVDFRGNGGYRYGALTKSELESLCREQDVSVIVDACHPFATELHATVASLDLPVPLIRFERKFGSRVQSSLVEYCDDFGMVLNRMQDQGFESMLGLSGVQTIPRLESYWRSKPAWFRILDRPLSRAQAAAYGFPADRLLFGQPQDEHGERKLLEQIRPAVMVTKESGLNGGLDAKLAAATATNTPVLVLKKPAVPDRFLLSNEWGHFYSLLLKCLN